MNLLKLIAIIAISVFCLALAGCATVPQGNAGTGKISAQASTIAQTAKAHAKSTTNPSDAEAFTEIYNEAVMLQAADVETAKTISTLQIQLKSAQDTAKLRDSLVWLAPSGLIIAVVAFAAWGYFQIRVLEYVGLGGAGVAIGAIVLYLSIQSIQMAMPWVLLGLGVLAVVAMVYWFIENRTKTVTQLVASTQAALTMAPTQAIAAMNKIQSPAVQAIVAHAKATNPSLATPIVSSVFIPHSSPDINGPDPLPLTPGEFP